MSYESRMIELINSVMPPSPLRKSAAGEVDCELILLGDKEYLITVDDFSPEDLLLEDDPFSLGWNLACGAISDVIAAAGIPLTYSHSTVIPPAWDEGYVKELSRGVAAVLQSYGVSFCGGDIGTGRSWRYTATVIGAPLSRKVNRRGCRAGNAIFLTGAIGAGNLQAALSLFSGRQILEKPLEAAGLRFRVHATLPEIVSRYASAAIDTSDGVFSALRTLSSLNQTGFHLHRLPYDPGASRFSQMLGLPALLLFMAECGEYEILMCVSQAKKAALMADLALLRIEATEIGVVTANPAQQTVAEADKLINLASCSISARDYPGAEEYLKAMLQWLASQGDHA